MYITVCLPLNNKWIHHSKKTISFPHTGSSTATSTSLNISPSSYLTVPHSRSSRLPISLPGPAAFDQEGSDAHVYSNQSLASEPGHRIIVPSRSNTPTSLCASQLSPSLPNPLSDRLYMSVYSSSSLDTRNSEFSNPPARRYRLPAFSNKMSSSQRISAVRSTPDLDQRSKPVRF